MIAHRVLQNALKQHWQFPRWPRRIFFGEFHHRVLDDVQCGVFVSHGVHRAFEGAFLDADQEVGEFFVGGQGGERVRTAARIMAFV